MRSSLLLNYILYSAVLFANFSCQNNIEESAEQRNFLNVTKDFNKQANLNSNNAIIIKDIKIKYAQKFASLKTVRNWRGKITLLDLDEVEQYSKDTVIMRIGIDNTYDTGYQDCFSFVEVMPISKKSKIFDMVTKIKKNSNVIFSGKILAIQHNNITPGFEFNGFFIETRFSDIEEMK